MLGDGAIEVDGPDLTPLDKEAGGHRIQRVPPTERRGRVHTSTCTVAVLDRAPEVIQTRSDSEFRIEWFSGTGKGGQHRNKHQNCCRMMHIPTGLVQVAVGRERTSNQRLARAELDRLLAVSQRNSEHERGAIIRKTQVGSGQRGDKRRTYRFQEDRVHDDITGKTARLSEVLAGAFDLLW